MTTDARDEPRGAVRFRELASAALRPLSVVIPVALVVCAGLVPPARNETGSVTILGATTVIAILILFALLALDRTFRAKWLRTGTTLLTGRESAVLALMTFLAGWWCFGLRLLSQGPGGGDGIGATAFIDGGFGTLMTIGVLFYWATRRPPARSSE